jgi:hypothetical protein
MSAKDPEAVTVAWRAGNDRSSARAAGVVTLGESLLHESDVVQRKPEA